MNKTSHLWYDIWMEDSYLFNEVIDGMEIYMNNEANWLRLVLKDGN